jgi:hypothetical protein
MSGDAGDSPRLAHAELAELAHADAASVDAVRPEPAAEPSDPTAHADSPSELDSGDLARGRAAPVDGDRRDSGNVAEQLRARLAGLRRRTPEPSEPTSVESPREPAVTPSGPLSDALIAQLGLSKAEAAGVIEQLALVVPLAVFVAILLTTVYNLGLGAGRTIGRLERVA